MVRSEPLRPGERLPLAVRPALEGVSLADWASSHRETIGRWLRENGGVLFRGFRIATPEDLSRLAAAVSGELLEYTYRSTPRSQVKGEVYTSTEYPAARSIPMHNEMAYSRSWPMKIFFFCAVPAAEGGETPIADSRAVFRRIDPAIRSLFTEKGVMYVRNYGEGIDLPWQTVFQTEERGEVEAFCQQAGIELEWKSGDRLRTRQRCQATAVHPLTGDDVWFNQAHLFHFSSLPAEVRDGLLSEFEPDDLPRNACFGDGSALDGAMLEEIRAAYDEESVAFPWQKGDVLLLDNMLVAHGRHPFSGERKVLVAMTEAHGSSN
ncbi:MAG: TauD/TfdA family dioxygenase [Acidobacteriota bacterium]